MKTLLTQNNGWESWVEVTDYGTDMKRLRFYSFSTRLKPEPLKPTNTLYLNKEACDNLIQALSQLKFD